MSAFDESNVSLLLNIEGIQENQEIKVFHGHSKNERVSILKRDNKYRIEYNCNILNLSELNAYTCIFGIYVFEKTHTAHHLVCVRIKGVITFKFNDLQKINGKTVDFEKHIHNHCLDDEIETTPKLRDKSFRRLGLVKGTIQVKKYPQASFYHRITNEEILSNCIKPWYDKIESLSSSFIDPIIKAYHVPWMRFVSGPLIPFSCVFLWQNRYFHNFEGDIRKCNDFVDIIMTLLQAAVSLHAEFDDINDFFSQCTNVISEDKRNYQAFICMKVILSILVSKCVSEPYITDLVKLTKQKVSINVDQLSLLSLVYGSDCEDGDKYAYELKRLITDSNWEMIIQTTSNNSNVIKLYKTIVKIYRMMYNFHATMYCGKDICHSINISIDINTIKKWFGISVDRKIKKNEEYPLKIIQDFKLFFNEGTSFSSPFQKPYEDYVTNLSDIIHQFDVISHELAHTPEMKIYDPTTSIGYRNEYVFYKYFTNFVTTDFLNHFPNTLDFAPILNDNIYGFGLKHIYSDSDSIILKPRLTLSNEYLNYFTQIVNGHHPDFELRPHQFNMLEKYFNADFKSKFNKILLNEIKNQGLLKKYRLIKSKNYITINVFPIGGYHSLEKFGELVIQKTSNIINHNPKISSFDFKIEKLYSSSNQTFFCSIRFIL